MQIKKNLINYYHMPILKWLEKENLTNRKLLDAGCGKAPLLRELQHMQRNIKLYGIDISEERIQQAKKNSSGLTLKVGDIERMEFKDETFDFVIACEVFEHLDYPQKAIKECHRVLKDKGQLLISIPCIWGLKLMGYLTFQPAFVISDWKGREHFRKFNKKKFEILIPPYFEIADYQLVRHPQLKIPIHHDFKLKKLKTLEIK